MMIPKRTILLSHQLITQYKDPVLTSILLSNAGPFTSNKNINTPDNSTLRSTRSSVEAIHASIRRSILPQQHAYNSAA
jgi:hypothetical protein